MLNPKRTAVFITAAGLAIGLLPAAAQSSELFIPLDLDESQNQRYFPAPDGLHYLYQGQAAEPFLHLVDVNDQANPIEIALPVEQGETIPVPRYTNGWYTVPVAWSPDGDQFVLAGANYSYLHDGDLWLYDLQTAEWTNLTDDGYGPDTLGDAILGYMEPGSPPLMIESQPAWSPDGASIAFERYRIEPDQPESAMISVLDVATGDIRDIAAVPKSPRTERNLMVTSGLDWSPDGSTLYFGVVDTLPEGRVDGLYRLDVASGDIEPLLTIDQMVEVFASVPDMAPRDGLRYWAGPLQVSPDGENLLVWLGYPNENTLYWPFVLNLTSETLTPVIPFIEGSVADQPFTALNAAWTADSTQVLVVAHRVSENPELAAAFLGYFDVESGGTQMAGELPEPIVVPVFIGVMSETGSTLLGGYHFQIE